MWARWVPVLGNFTAVLSIHESEKAENHCINSTVINKQIATDTKVFFYNRMLRRVGLLGTKRERDREGGREEITGEWEKKREKIHTFNLRMLLQV
jgi:hypothetical protein